MAWRGESLTLSIAEWTAILGPSRSDGGVCSLSDILETGDHLSRYSLSPKACAGILRRAEKRGKVLPEASCPRGGSGYRLDSDTAENLIAETLRSHGGDPAATQSARSSAFDTTADHGRGRIAARRLKAGDALPPARGRGASSGGRPSASKDSGNDAAVEVAPTLRAATRAAHDGSQAL